MSLGRLTAAAAAKGLRPPFGSEHTGVHDCGQRPILGMEFVPPSGEIVRTDDDDGNRHRLPEPVRPAGPSSVITEVTMPLECARSSAEPPDDVRAEVSAGVGIAYFGTVADACQAMRAVLSGGTLPARLEFVDEARLATAAATGLLGIRSDAAALLVFGGDAVAPLSLTELRLIGESWRAFRRAGCRRARQFGLGDVGAHGDDRRGLAGAHPSRRMTRFLATVVVVDTPYRRSYQMKLKFQTVKHGAAKSSGR